MAQTMNDTIGIRAAMRNGKWIAERYIPTPSDMISMEAIRLHEQDNSKSIDEYTDQLYGIMPQYKYENKK